MAGERFSSPLAREPDLIESPGNPFKFSLTVSAVFFALGMAYIVFSSHLAAVAAGTIPHMESIERTKGILFVVVTTGLLFGIIYGMLLRIDRQQRRLLSFGNRLIAAERQASALVLADSVAREISTLVMTLEYNIEELAEAAGEEKPVALGKVNSAQTRLKDLVRRLTQMESRHARKSYFDLCAAVKDALTFVEKHRNLRACRIHFRGPDQLMFMGSLILVYQAVLNLVLNAAEAVGGQCRIQVQLMEDGEFIEVRVDDNGPGIAPGRRQSVMAPFYTTKPNGSGLGLLSVEACARAHDGTVEISDSDLGGALFALRLKKAPAVFDDGQE